jgi:hypothetical protein
LVHVRKKQIRLKEMELHALCAMTSENSKSIEAHLKSYRKMLFPGDVATAEDNELERAKRLLAQEAQKVLLVTPLKPGEALPGKMPKQLAPIAGRTMADRERERLKELQNRRARGKPKRRSR